MSALEITDELLNDWQDGNNLEHFTPIQIEEIAAAWHARVVDRGKREHWHGRSPELNAPDLLDVVDAGEWLGVEPEPRRWMVKDWEPSASCTYLTGIGASGKSLLVQQRMTCSAAGLPFLGLATTPGISIYVTCEDTIEEVHRRQQAINTTLGVSYADLRGRLFLASLKGIPNNELCTFDAAGRMETTARYDELRDTIRTIGATHVALDNVAHLFAGNENVRNQVAAFTGLLDRLAAYIGGGVLLIGHPNKEGAEYSGSTAWENQVRARIYLSLAAQAGNRLIDPNGRRLTNSKPNYSQRGAAVDFMWHDWAFVLPDALPPGLKQEQALNAQAAEGNTRFLECLDKATAERRAVSASPAAANYAPRLFAKMPTARGMPVSQFEAAMHRLLHLGTIIGEQRLYQRANRAWVMGLGRAPTIALTMHEAGAQTCTEVQTKPLKALALSCTRTAPLDTTYLKEGAAPTAAAPNPRKGNVYQIGGTMREQRDLKRSDQSWSEDELGPGPFGHETRAPHGTDVADE